MNPYGQGQPVNIGVIGYGYWGPNIVRNFNCTPDAAVIWVCDLNPKSLERVRRFYPEVGVSTDPADILNNPAIDAVAIVDSTRVNLGLFQHDANVVWDLAPHDLAII